MRSTAPKYKPKTFKGARSESEEHRLAAGAVQKIILEILIEFDRTNERLDVLLREGIHRHHKILSPADRSKIAGTVQGVIVWLARLDYLISKSLKTHAAKLEPAFRCACRLAAYYVTILERTAEHAMSLLDLALPKSPAGNKDAVQRLIGHLATEGWTVPLPSAVKQPLTHLSVTLSHPEWLIALWLDTYGESALRKICDFNNSAHPLTIRVNTLKADRSVVEKTLAQEKFSVKSARWASDAIEVADAKDLFTKDLFRQGAFEIQAESSQLFAAWADPKPGSVILDACAGGGGKTLAWSAMMKNEGRIVATDSNDRSLGQLRKRAERAGCRNVEIWPPARWRELSSIAFDKVIIDAPCSGLGVLHRNPDIRWRMTPDHMENLVREQRTLLDKHASLVRPGGQLIYGTCTMNPAENEDQVKGFLERHLDFYQPAETDERFRPFFDDRGFFSVKPHEHGLSGFFGARLVRR